MQEKKKSTKKQREREREKTIQRIEERMTNLQ